MVAKKTEDRGEKKTQVKKNKILIDNFKDFIP